MPHVFCANRRMLPWRGPMLFAVALVSPLNNFAVAQDDLDNSPAMREISANMKTLWTT